jgi:hypothetical protein
MQGPLEVSAQFEVPIFGWDFAVWMMYMHEGSGDTVGSHRRKRVPDHLQQQGK